MFSLVPGGLRSSDQSVLIVAVQGRASGVLLQETGCLLFRLWSVIAASDLATCFF